MSKKEANPATEDAATAKELFSKAYEKQEKELEGEMESIFDVKIHSLHKINLQNNWSLHLLVALDGTISNINCFSGYGMAKTARTLGGYIYMDGMTPIPLIHNFIIQTIKGDMVQTISITKRKTLVPHEHVCDSYHPCSDYSVFDK